MDTFEEEITTALQNLFAKVDALSQINIRDLLKPDVYYRYERTLQDAYDALTKVEDTLNSLGIKLEYHHWRLGEAVEELKPLLIQTSSLSDRITEEFERRISHIYDQLSPETTG